MALQDIPQMFSCMHCWQMRKPHRQRQQKAAVSRQQWQSCGPVTRQRFR
jgi:hypothetical protein